MFHYFLLCSATKLCQTSDSSAATQLPFCQQILVAVSSISKKRINACVWQRTNHCFMEQQKCMSSLIKLLHKLFASQVYMRCPLVAGNNQTGPTSYSGTLIVVVLNNLCFCWIFMPVACQQLFEILFKQHHLITFSEETIGTTKTVLNRNF